MNRRDFWEELGLLDSVKNFVFLGEAGCGKSEIAINFGRLLLEQGEKPVHLFDLDMTKPLFRSRDLRDTLCGMGMHVHYERQFMDAPTAIGGVSRHLRDVSCYTVLDVGGDAIGARSIGGYAKMLMQPDTVVYYVINPFRPWSMSLERIDRVLGETLGVSHLSLDRLHLTGNPNLGSGTTPQDVREGYRTLEELLRPYKTFDFYCVRAPLFEQLQGEFSHPLLPLQLHLSPPWDNSSAGG